ncbi:SapC family protein [Neptunicella marina]|uniref:SapC family protein n=1 Tax=Neptunicella marina TaxID=2125989 RepID=A0A8J6IT88_9ALTE|nr:SapC family protein [Neptunicella marina]MBC3766321.1 SapC family protein [Neptunicella marina]
MAKNVLVNSIDHQDLKVITERSANFGDNLWYTLTFPSEFRSLQAYYPIFFQKDVNTGKFHALALFGFQNEENLFLKDGKWDAGYIPLTIARQPFSIGIHKVSEDGEEKMQRMLHIDLDNPRVNKSKGEALFLEHGGNTPYLDMMADMLEVIHHGMLDSQEFIESLIELELLEAFTADITLQDGSKYQMVGFYTINEEKLNELNGNVLESLNKKGYLQAIYMALASQANVSHLIKRKNATLSH